MERFTSLINSLKSGFEEGKSNTELLSLLDEMRNELTKSRPPSDHTLSPVSVWLPAGYQPVAEKIIQPVIEAKTPESVPVIIEEMPAVATEIKENLSSEKSLAAEKESFTIPKEPFITVAGPSLATGVPRPPRIAIIEESEEDLQEELPVQTSLFPEDDDFLLPGNFHIHPNGIFREGIPVTRVREMEFPSDEPIVVELELPEETETTVLETKREHSMTITDNFLKNSPSTIAEGRPLELHEILANRVVAQPANGEILRQGKVLADTFAGGKIQDLRKAIAINDRFRFIKSLFRGDDTLFERSVKTINNFNILQEAQYWMQRELVIKLGWNEEDELVQMFYQLVSRRFL